MYLLSICVSTSGWAERRGKSLQRWVPSSIEQNIGTMPIQERENRMRFRFAGVFLMVWSICLGVAYSQERGQYLLGSYGLNAGIQSGSGFNYSNLPGWYSASRFKAPDNGPVLPVVGDARYSVALGPQASFIVPKWNLSCFFRYEPEFAASSHVEGTSMIFGGSINFPVAR